MRTTTSLKAQARPAPVLAATLGLAAVGWVITVPRMSGMDMGTATMLGSFPFFLSVWPPMMAAMMLPGVAPSAAGRYAAERYAAGRSAVGLARYLASYLAIWMLFGVALFAVYRPHGHAAAGVMLTAAGIYELTPAKRRFREMCRQHRSTGLGLGACCVGSTAGLMLAMVALGPMSLTWMALVAAVVVLQKLAPPKALIDIPLAVAILGLALIQLTR